MKEKVASYKIKYVCLFGVLQIAIQETEIRLKLKACSGETKELRVSKEGREDLHT